MLTVQDYYTWDYWYSKGWTAPWLKETAPEYLPEMIQSIGEQWMRRDDWKEHIFSERGRETLRTQLFLRMSQASEVFVPWLAQALDPQGLRILEIGCGSGSSTAGLARAGAVVTGADIKGPSLAIASKRLALLGLEADLVTAAHDWLKGEVDLAPFGGPYDLIVCYAVLEHLLIPERLNLLAMCRRIMQRDGALLATFETPNRFSPRDWHTSKLLFGDAIPDELAYEFAKRRSSRKDHPAKRFESFSEEANDAMYRFGRGVSFHEFDLAFGLTTLTVHLDGYSFRQDHQAHYGADRQFEEALARVFSVFEPSPPRGFCRPSLDLLLEYRL